jgi:hypothetical protein
MKAVNRSWMWLFSLLCSAFLVFAVTSFTQAETKAKTSPAKLTKAKTSASKPAKTKASKAPSKEAPPPPIIDEAAVHSSFDTFTQEWMKKLAEAEEYHRKELLKVSQNGDSFSAEYIGYLPQRFIEIKRTTSSETPFVGTLTYYERTLRCTGKTREAAAQGPFEQVETSPVKEIFRYTKGKWVY